jgi:DNA polymerase III subunit chi
MTEKVDFYVLKSTVEKQRWSIACRLTEKAYLRDMRVVILNESAADAQAFDDLLWTFSDRSFVPHQYCRDAHSADADTPVHLTVNLEAVGTADLLINLSTQLPVGLERFTRIAEIIDADPGRRRLGRERFKSYREHKLPLQTHHLEESADV